MSTPVEKCLQRAWIEQSQIDHLLSEQAQRYATARASLESTAFIIDLNKQCLSIHDPLTDRLLKEFPLELPLLADAPSLSVSVLHADGSQRQSHYRESQLTQYGLIVTANNSYVYQSDFLEKPWLNSAFHPAPHADIPYDLYAFPEHDLFCLANRIAGSIQIYSVTTQNCVSTLSIRPQGISKPLNICLSELHHCLYISDSQSFMLHSIDLDNWEHNKIDIGLSGYALGNLAISPDQEHLYLLTLKPTQSLLYLDLDSHELIKEIPLKGTLCSLSQHLPYDLLQYDAQQQNLLLMSHFEDEESTLPLISVIDAEKGKTLQRYTLKDTEYPQMLVYEERNLLLANQKPVLELLVAEGLLSEIQLAQLNQVDLDAPDAPEEGQGAVPELTAQAAEYFALDPEASVAILLEKFERKLYQVYADSLSAHPEWQAHFEAEAEQTRLFLERHDGCEVHLSLSGQSLSLWIQRDELLQQLSQRFRIAEENPPSHCPSCQATLEDWICGACGLELLSPEQQIKLAQSSRLSTQSLPLHHILIADPLRRRILQLDHNRTLDWSLEGDAFADITPWQALTLENHNLLIVDRQSHQIHEISPAGKHLWSLPQDNAELQLNQPAKVSVYQQNDRDWLLIVDQGHHRVFATDREGVIHWEYGIQGENGASEGQLDLPSDMHWTWEGSCLITDTGNHRVLEVNRDSKQIMRSWGAEWGLSGPVFAQRLPQGNTLIVDAGNYRILEIDLNDQLINECFYFKEEMGETLRLDLPLNIIRGQRQNLLLLDEEKILEIWPHKRRLVWSSLLEHLARRVDILEDDGEAKRYSQSFYQHKMPSMEDMLERLRAREAENPNSLNARLMENFTRLLDVNRQRDRQRALLAKALQNQSALSDTPLFSLDRTHHYVLQLNREGEAIWHFGGHQLLQRPSQISESDDGKILLADTGNHRIVELTPGLSQVSLSIGSKQERLLNQPRSAFRTLNGNILIADTGNRRLVEMNTRGEVLWEYKNLLHIVSPYYACEQGTGTILFVDWALQMVKEIDRDGTLLWSYGQSRRVGQGPNQLSSPEYAVRLVEGSTLIADTHNHRVIEVAPNRTLLWEFKGTPEVPLHQPCFCKRLSNGNTLVAFDNYRQMVEVDLDGELCWQFTQGQQALVSI